MSYSYCGAHPDHCNSGGRPRIVVLCGSTRFYDQYQQANYEETMAGRIVLSVGFYPHAEAVHGHGEGVGHDSSEKVALDELHKRKIDLADEVLVVSDETGYIGESTRSEIEYAVKLGRPIRYWRITATPATYAIPAEPGPEVTQLWDRHGEPVKRNTSRGGGWWYRRMVWSWLPLLGEAGRLSTAPPDTDAAPSSRSEDTDRSVPDSDEGRHDGR